jgi:UDP-2-acetamido-2-deoxy-ribo-hexuluronate aminotransferase
MSRDVIPFIDLKAQYEVLKGEINKRIQRVLDHGQYVMGPEVQELEDRLLEYVGTKHCITAASGTEALLISLMALGIGVGDEVITTPFTFFATTEVIIRVGATPIFVDIDPSTCNINSKLIESAITLKTKAILPVSLYGQPADMDEINIIAAKYNLYVIEDAAQSFGAVYKGKKSCSLSLLGCTSFFPSKPLGCYGDGGAVFTNDDRLAQVCREIRVHGQSERYVHSRIGLGGRMDTLQCAIVLAKLERFDWEVESRLKVGRIYNELIDEIHLPRVLQKEDRTSVFAQYTIFVEGRDTLRILLQEEGIPTAVHYPIPANSQKVFEPNKILIPTPLAANISDRVMSLPMSADLSRSDQIRIVEALERTIKRKDIK